MSLLYEQQTVLVTGSSKGIGKSLCEHFLANGARVVGMSRSAATIENPNYIHYSVDITDEKAVVEVFRRVRTDVDSVEVLVNNAGVATSQFTALMPGSSAEAMMKTNFLGAFLITKECTKLMMKKKYGRVIHISSMMLPLSPVGSAIYSATKSALTQFSKVFAKEVSAYDITSNTIGISAIESDMWSQLSKEKLAESLAELPIKRPATMDELTHLIDFLAEKKSRNITGQVIYLNGAS